MKFEIIFCALPDEKDVSNVEYKRITLFSDKVRCVNFGMDYIDELRKKYNCNIKFTDIYTDSCFNSRVSCIRVRFDNEESIRKMAVFKECRTVNVYVGGGTGIFDKFIKLKEVPEYISNSFQGIILSKKTLRNITVGFDWDPEAVMDAWTRAGYPLIWHPDDHDFIPTKLQYDFIDDDTVLHSAGSIWCCD